MTDETGRLLRSAEAIEKAVSILASLPVTRAGEKARNPVCSLDLQDCLCCLVGAQAVLERIRGANVAESAINHRLGGLVRLFDTHLLNEFDEFAYAIVLGSSVSTDEERALFGMSPEDWERRSNATGWEGDFNG